MKGTALIYEPGIGIPRIEEITASVRLERLRGWVGGHIELVPGFNQITFKDEVHRCVAFCNEEGKLKRLPVNAKATVLWDEALPGGLRDKRGQPLDVLVGPVVVIFGDDELMEDL